MKLSLSSILSGYNLSKINANFQAIVTELQNKVLYRDNPVGEPNAMQNALDMNSNHILNLPAPTSDLSPVRAVDISGLVAGTPTAALVTFVPAGTISSINVQSAIEEVAAEAQPLDAGLTSFSSLGTAADKIIYTTGVDTWAESPVTAYTLSLIDDPDANTAKTTLAVHTSSTGSTILASGTTAQRDSTPSAGYIRFNSDYATGEIYNGTSWAGLGGATGAGGDDIFYENGTNVTTSYTITSGKNAMSAGPITIDTGATVTVPTGSTWTIV